MGGIIMKEFNLEEYLKNPSQKVVTRDSRAVRIICTDYKSDYPIIGLVTIEENKELAYNFQKNGRYYFSEKESSLDLFFAPTKREGWINVYRLKDDTRTIGCLYKSEEEANLHKYDRASKYIKTIKIEWEE